MPNLSKLMKLEESKMGKKAGLYMPGSIIMPGSMSYVNYILIQVDKVYIFFLILLILFGKSSFVDILRAKSGGKIVKFFTLEYPGDNLPNLS